MDKRNIKKRNKTSNQQHQCQQFIYTKIILNQNKVLGTKNLQQQKRQDTKDNIKNNNALTK